MTHIANPPVRRAKPMVWRDWQFASQTEAYAAMFLSHLGIPFLYEAEAYVIDDEPTRPDFWLPDQSAWLEIKGHDDFDDRQVRRLSSAHDEPLYVATAPLWYSSSNANSGDSILLYRGGQLAERHYEFCRCLRCGAWTIEYRGWHSKHSCGMPKNYFNHSGDEWSVETRRIIRAAGEAVESFKAWRAIGR